jgi:acetylornithine deacetylase/succinyl-diaminopimelate desuccinylase-like protein
MEYYILYAPQDPEEQVKREVEEQIHRFAQTDPWLRDHVPEVEWLKYLPPYDVPADAPICKAIASAYEVALDKAPRFYGFADVDDATWLNLAGIPAVTVGPGNLFVAHAPNEYVEIAELVDAAKLYALSVVM